MSEIKELLARIDTLTERQRFDIAVLALWAHAKETTGHTHETIRAFTFRKEYLTQEQSRANKVASRQRKPPVYCDKNWHNALRLKNNSVVSMPGVTRPSPPADLPASAKVVIDV